MGETTEMTGGEALARMLAAHEIGPMFGMGGFQLLPFYDAARRLGIDHNLVNDERCGVFAADAWAKVTGRVGVCDATLGPGATNLLTGMIEALNAGTPLVLIAGDSHRDHSWKNMTQESRQMEILRPAAKELIRIESIQRIPELVRRAFSVATRGRPGPVVLDVPEDIAHGRHAFDSADLTADPSCHAAPSLRTRPDAESLEAAAALLRDAKRPLVLAGGGIHLSGAAQALTDFVEAQSLPVAHTMTGKGAIACTHPLSVGLFGRYDRIANDLIARSDCLLVTGCKLGEIATRRFALIPDGVPLIHLDILAEEFGRTAPPSVEPLGRLSGGNPRPRPMPWPVTRSGFASERADYVAEVRARMAELAHRGRPPPHLERIAHQHGAHDPRAESAPRSETHCWSRTAALPRTGAACSTTRRLPGRGFVPDRGFASIGYGLPGAMGARLAAPGRQVVGITGDGGFNMVIGELETARSAWGSDSSCSS